MRADATRQQEGEQVMPDQFPDELTKIKLGDKTWRLSFVEAKDLPKKCWGDCSPDKRLMRVRTCESLSDQHWLDTLIHEQLHAALWPISEEWVAQTATEIARVLLATGRIEIHRE